jgi:hypothetical protein
MRRFGTRGKARGFEHSPSVAQNRVLRLVPRRSAAFRRPSVDHSPHLSGRVAIVYCSRCSCQERPRTRPESIDPAQDLGEQRAWHRELGQLERDVAGVTRDPGTELDQLIAQGG